MTHCVKIGGEPHMMRVPQLEVDLPDGYEVYEGVEFVILLCRKCFRTIASYSAQAPLSAVKMADETAWHELTSHGPLMDRLGWPQSHGQQS